MTRVEVPDPSLVVLAGPSGCGKSTFARAHFSPDDVLSTDAFRQLVAGDAGDQTASSAAFSLLRHALDERARRRRLTVVDATNLTPRDRRRLRGVARRYDLPSVVVAFDLPLTLCRRRAAERLERVVGAEVVERQHATFRRHLEGLRDEGFGTVVVVTEQDLDQLEVVRRPARDPLPRPAPVEGTEEMARPRPPALVVDLDGTLTSAAWREHHLHDGPRDWPAFFAGMGRDAPVAPLVDLVAWVVTSAHVVLLTGRPAEHETVVRRWLADHRVPYDDLLMRPVGDRRPDTVVKRELYREHVAPGHDVRVVIDDRPRVVEMWRDEGLYVLTAVDPRLDPLPDPGRQPRDPTTGGQG